MMDHMRQIRSLGRLAENYVIFFADASDELRQSAIT
jgi:hypothetical protein